MPWLHLHIGDKGKVSACCVANIPFGNINEKSLEEVWQGNPVIKLRRKFLKGEKDNRCSVCINREATGAKSIRQETFERFPDFPIPDDATSSLPIYFDIRFSNTCNFRCRTCWHGASSKWYTDAKALGRSIANKAIINNIGDFELFIAKTGPALIKAEEIYFAGGEPLVTEAHYRLLEWLIARKSTAMRLRYNTNLSVLHFRDWDIKELWSSFSSVEVLASIDASGILGEYVRKEMSWSTFLQHNMELNALPYVHLKWAPTVSVFNILQLPDLYLEGIEKGMIAPEDWYINILDRPLHYNVQVLPHGHKQKVINRYNRFFTEVDLLESIRTAFSECIDYMMAKDKSTIWPAFIKETKELDRLRREDLERVIRF